MSHKRQAHTAIAAFSFYPNEKFDYLGNYKFADKFNGSLNDGVLDSLAISTIKLELNKNTEKTYSVDNMPCVRPEGLFSMRVFKPDSTVTYTILVENH